MRKINDTLRESKYEEAKFWSNLFGKPVKDLWNEYRKSLDEGAKDNEGSGAGEKTPKEVGSGQSIEGGATQGDAAFWDFVKEKKGPEETIVLKAVWRTRRHLQKDAENDDLSKQIDDLWFEYEDNPDKKRSEVEENQDEDAIMVGKDASMGKGELLPIRSKESA